MAEARSVWGMAKGVAASAGLRSLHATAGLETVAWYCASSSVNVGMVAVSTGGRAEKKCELVDVRVAVLGSCVVSDCVAVWFMVFSLRGSTTGLIERQELRGTHGYERYYM